MKSPAPIRIHWRDFVGTRANHLITYVLRLFSYQLVVEFNEQKEATDVYIVSNIPRPAK